MIIASIGARLTCSVTTRISRHLSLSMHTTAAATNADNTGAATGALTRMQLRLRSQRSAASIPAAPRVPAILSPPTVGTRSSSRIKHQLNTTDAAVTSPDDANAAVASSIPRHRKRAVASVPTALAYEESAVKTEDAADVTPVELVSSTAASPVMPKKLVKKSKRADDSGESRVKRTAPPNWKQVLEGIQKMRAAGDAEVDSMGCEFYKNSAYAPHEWRFHTLVSAMLSSQTKDSVNAAAMERLLTRDGGLTVQSMLEINENELAQLIHPVGFYRNKAKYIKQVATILTAQARDADVVDIPSTFDGLVALPGVGPKMAYLVMDCAWSNVVGICVDTHVHRISNRLGWVKTWNTKNPKVQDPEKTRAELQDWLPREHWGPINLLLVGFGQTICQPRGPKCNECAISHLCPSAFRSTI